MLLRVYIFRQSVLFLYFGGFRKPKNSRRKYMRDCDTFVVNEIAIFDCFEIIIIIFFSVDFVYLSTHQTVWPCGELWLEKKIWDIFAYTYYISISVKKKNQ